MGYSHRWYRERELPASSFEAFAEDVEKILEGAEQKGIELAGRDGRGRPVVTRSRVAYNGSVEQSPGPWTTEEAAPVPWPDDEAGLREPASDPSKQKTSGKWVAGTLVSQPVAPERDGSYEPFSIPQVLSPPSWRTPPENGRWFKHCKTGYRPYDIAVQATLLAAKRHFGDRIRIDSDGSESDWLNGLFLCMSTCGYGEQLPVWSDE